jgi:UvrD-like helicase C-terminal domain
MNDDKKQRYNINEEEPLVDEKKKRNNDEEEASSSSSLDLSGCVCKKAPFVDENKKDERNDGDDSSHSHLPDSEGKAAPGKHANSQQQQKCFSCTEEQQAIVYHVRSVSSGDVIRVSALAGCRKTTTMALLCNEWKEATGNASDLLYSLYQRSCGRGTRQLKVSQRNGNPNLAQLCQAHAEFSKGVVICRSNTGMLKFLLHHFVLNSNGTTAAATQKSRAYYGKSVKLPAISQKLLQLNAFVQDKHSPFKHDGEEFSTLVDLQEYFEDAHDLELGKHISLLGELSKCLPVMSLHDFISKIKQSQVISKEGESVDDFDGVLLMACHAAKGLEFNQVIVYNDFPFAHLMNPVIIELLRLGTAFPYFQEAKDIICVAVTRAKKTIYLSPEAAAYFTFLEDMRLLPTTKNLP